MAMAMEDPTTIPRRLTAVGGVETNSPRQNRRRRRWLAKACTPPVASTALLLLAAFLALPSGRRAFFAEAYFGPAHCRKRGHTAFKAVTRAAGNAYSGGRQTELGYLTFNHLLFDLASVTSDYRSGRDVPPERLTFTICPGSVLDLDDSTLPLGFLPIAVPGMTVKCGNDGRRGGSDPSEKCVLRGGGRKDPRPDFEGAWANAGGESKDSPLKGGVEGVVGGGNTAMIYVYGETAYGVTISGLTFDNAPSQKEVEYYRKYSEEPSPSAAAPGQRRGVDDASPIRPAHRYTAIAVRGKGYGDDAGPQLIRVHDCRFDYHTGYVVLVSPGIREPDMPNAPKFDFPDVPVSGDVGSDGGGAGGGGEGGASVKTPEEDEALPPTVTEGDGNGSYRALLRQSRHLDLMDDGRRYVSGPQQVSYYVDRASTTTGRFRDGHRVAITNCEFTNNAAAGFSVTIATDGGIGSGAGAESSSEASSVAGIVTSAYSIIVSGCFFQRNAARSMVFAYNDKALVENSVFAENVVEVSTVVLMSPEGPNTSAPEKEPLPPTHVVERTCFLGSHVGMSNVLSTDNDDAPFGQRNNHALGTSFTWISDCQGTAVESRGKECLETGLCDGMCVAFDAGECLADKEGWRDALVLSSSTKAGVSGGRTAAAFSAMSVVVGLWDLLF